MRLGFATAMRVPAAGGDERLVLLFVEIGQLLQERGHVPDVLIAHALAPSRHARHLDAVLDDPERDRGIDFVLCQVRRRRIQALRSEEHTSELQSLMRSSYAVFCLKKKNKENVRQ